MHIAERAGVLNHENLDTLSEDGREVCWGGSQSRGQVHPCPTLASVVILRQHQAPGTFTMIALLRPKARMAAAAIVIVASFNVCNKNQKKTLYPSSPRILVLGVTLCIRDYA